MGFAVVLVNTSEIEAVEPEPARLLIPTTTARVQEKVGLAFELVAVYVKVDALQIAVGVNVELSVGLGFTTTVTLWVLVQLLAVVM
jgi:hypothetical protein